VSGFTHEPPGGGKPDWYTPPWVFEQLDCGFTLDPCHPAKRLFWVPAARIISLPDDGLALPWEGKVWLNPPYGRETPLWLDKLARHGEGIALVFARTDTQWFHDVMRNASAVLFMKDRVRFIDSYTMKEGGSPGCGSALIGYGKWAADILTDCKVKGTIVRRDHAIPSWLM